MKLPKSEPVTASRIISLCNRWRSDDYASALDRRELMRHFNGGALETEDRTAGRPRARRANLLFGNKLLGRSVMQLFSFYNNGIGMLDFKLKPKSNVRPSRRLYVESVLNREANTVVRDSGRLYWNYKAVCGDAVTWGNSFLWRDNPYDWAPKYGRPLMPWNAPADISDPRFSDWAIAGELNVTDLITMAKRADKVGRDAASWNYDAIMEIISRIVKRHQNGTAFWSGVDVNDPVQMEEALAGQQWAQTIMDTSVPVYWFFSKRFDKAQDDEGAISNVPIDLYCVPRFGEIVTDIAPNGSEPWPTLKIGYGDDKGSPSSVLFYSEAIFADVRECLFPFQLSMQLAGDPLMRRVMGLGMLNYDLDIRIQHSVSAMLEGAEFDFSYFWENSDSVAAEQLKMLSSQGLRSGDVLPFGTKFTDKPKGGRPYNGLMEITQMLNNEMGANAAAFASAGFENDQRADTLEVQVLERQARNSQMLGQRADDWARNCDQLCSAMGKTLVSSELLPCDRGYPQQRALRDRLEECGIDWSEVEDNVVVLMRRAPGHGDSGLALARAKQVLTIAPRFGPDQQTLALRQYVAAVFDGDQSIALEYVPEVPQHDQSQQMTAQSQDAIAFATLAPAPVMPADQPVAHVPVHMQTLQRIVTAAGQNGNRWSSLEHAGFTAAAAHAMIDIRNLAAWNMDGAKQAAQMLKALVAAAERMQISDVQPAMDPKSQMELALKAREQQRRETKDQTDLQRWQISQQHRQQMGEEQNLFQMASLNETQKNNTVKRASLLAKTAMDAVQMHTSNGDSDSDGQ